MPRELTDAEVERIADAVAKRLKTVVVVTPPPALPYPYQYEPRWPSWPGLPQVWC